MWKLSIKPRSLARKAVNGCREKHSGKKEERPLCGCRQASERPRYDDDKWDRKLMSLTCRTYLLLCAIMSHYALMDMKCPLAKQPAGNSFKGKERRKGKIDWIIRFTSHLSDKLCFSFQTYKTKCRKSRLRFTWPMCQVKQNEHVQNKFVNLYVSEHAVVSRQTKKNAETKNRKVPWPRVLERWLWWCIARRMRTPTGTKTLTMCRVSRWQ